ncbi:MAG TPA: HemK/PrmC family methyltransferase, partial [Anaerolineaceae bacterium]|nr:HemK/PrmC family methyltransferase [Anaerolineaceae bacterium]
MLQISIRDCLLEAQAELSLLDNPQHSAIILMAHVLNRPKTWIIAHGNETLGERQKTEFFALTKRLAQGEPLPYITGKQSFYGLDFKVSPSVLIPRPETERLVDKALLWLRANPLASHALDVGTGSACIAVSLAKHHPALT